MTQEYQFTTGFYLAPGKFSDAELEALRQSLQPWRDRSPALFWDLDFAVTHETWRRKWNAENDADAPIGPEPVLLSLSLYSDRDVGDGMLMAAIHTYALTHIAGGELFDAVAKGLEQEAANRLRASGDPRNDEHFKYRMTVPMQEAAGRIAAWRETL